ncbi:MAG: hypothetical protein HVN34_01825 [Methanobacteriaceae archaeon]|jgi:hypothetical protein|nr:hypothetical protein [Candidatus Methanofastidiosa archaeon]NYB26064.1 hypothetical protein [Methanobacteriaceae archaeon]
MLNLEEILTERVKQLLKETDSILPNKKIFINEMTDVNQLNESDGALVAGDSVGNATIFLDPKRVDEYRLAHEILHIKYYRLGWVKLYLMIPENFSIQIQPLLDNLISHYLIYPDLQEMGIDNLDHVENFITDISEWETKWKRTEIDGLSVLENGLAICEGLLFGEPYRDKIINITSKNYPNSLNLAYKLEQIVISGELDKKDVRKAAVNLLSYVDDYVHNIHPEIPNLCQTIGITPLFTKAELKRKASKYVHFNSARMNINNKIHYLAFFFMKSDKTRFITYIGDDKTEPSYIPDIRKLWQTKNLEELLSSIDVIYGITK